MPPKGYSTKKEIEQLRKELELARGSLQDKDSRIAHLGTKVASKIEEIAALQTSIDLLRPAAKENVELKSTLAKMQEQETAYRAQLATMGHELQDTRTELAVRNRQYLELLEENGAARNLLKAVL